MSRPMQNLHSIQKINFQYPTRGSEPVEVLCNDLNYYVCKYSDIPAHQLMREYLGNQFLHRWNIRVPQGAFVTISQDHLSNNLSDRAQPRCFFIPTFGVQKHKFAKEIDALWVNGLSEYYLKLIDRADFLKIILFDLWVSNEDRHAGNYNLMVDSGTEEISPYFLPIDHATIFNSGSEYREIYLISIEESLVSSPLFSRFCKRSATLEKEILEVLDEFPLLVHNCHEEIDHILAQIPTEWKIDIIKLKEYLNDNIFRPSWREEVIFHFTSYIQQSLS